MSTLDSRRLLAVATLVVCTWIGACGAGGSGPDGLYLMTRYAFGSLQVEAWRFEDGVAVRNPVASPGKLDAEAERAVHPHDVGSYRRDGDDLEMAMGGGKPVKAKFEREDHGCFGWDAGAFCPVEGFGNDVGLDGRYSGGVSVRGAASSMTIDFKSDGTYTLDSAGSASATSDRSTFTGGGSGGEHGKYELSGTLLTLKPEGGAERRIPTFVYDDGTQGPAPRRMYFAGAMLNRQD
jgi:hypothetical protein